MKPAAARPEEITELLLREPVWRREGEVLRAEWNLDDFAAALQFVNRVGELAEAMNHHPDIDIRWNRVVLRLTTHSIGGLSVLDLELASRIAEIS